MTGAAASPAAEGPRTAHEVPGDSPATAAGGLALVSLSLSHFRSHERLSLDLDGGPVAIHGPNGAGKTNILEAVSMLSPGRGLRRAAAEDLAHRPDAPGWKVFGLLESRGRRREIATWAQTGQGRQVVVDGKPATQTALGRVARIVWLVPSMDRLWTDAAEGRRRFLDRLALSFEPEHAEAALSYEKALRQRNRLLKDQSRDVGWYAALETRMASAGARMIANRCSAVARLASAQADARTTFPAADLAISGPPDEPEIGTEDDLSAALAGSRERDMAAGRTLVGPHRADMTGVYAAKGVPARDCSTGEQKALLVSLVLANARALYEDFGTPPILLLDEVAAHLDAGRRAALYDELRGLGAQAWMTGTDAELFAELGGGAMYLEVAESGGLSEIRTSRGSL